MNNTKQLTHFRQTCVRLDKRLIFLSSLSLYLISPPSPSRSHLCQKHCQPFCTVLLQKRSFNPFVCFSPWCRLFRRLAPAVSFTVDFHSCGNSYSHGFMPSTLKYQTVAEIISHLIISSVFKTGNSAFLMSAFAVRSTCFLQILFKHTVTYV